MKAFPRVSVVIPAFNAAVYLERAVRSVFATDYQDIQVIMVDDGSTDATLETAVRLCAEFGAACLLLRHPDHGNHGVSASRNLGIESSDGEWIAFLDADDLYLPHRFDAFKRLIEHGEAMDAVYELCRISCEASHSEASQFAHLGDGALFGIAQPLEGTRLLDELLQGRCWATSAITVRRSLLEKTGVFDPEKRIAEDCDLWMRLAASGRIVPGELARPCSVYSRHDRNTYSYAPENRSALLAAMLDAWHWAERSACSDDMLKVFRQGVETYALRGMVALREAKRPDLAIGLWRQMVRHRRWRASLRPTLLRQLLAAVRERQPAAVEKRQSRERRA